MHSLLAALLSLGILPAAGGRSVADDSAGFVTILGRDTIALESFSRTATRLQGEIVLRVPGTVHFRYTFELNPDGTVSHSVVDLKPLAAPDLVSRRVTLDFVKDSVQVTIDSAGSTQHVTYAARPGTAPLLLTGFDSSFGIYASFGMYELLFSRPAFAITDTTTVPAIGALSGRVGTRRFLRRSADRVDVDFFGIAWTHLTVDQRGHILAADAIETTEKTQTRRTGPLDVARAAKEFAARDRAGRGVGIASPADSVRTTLGPAHLAIDYSSPRKRGRTILGVVVPYDRVWRTGANSATTLWIDRPIIIGTTTVPAGGYTLWTRPTATGVELIINRQHGQWGTEYDPSQDLARIPMVVSAESAPRENFSIVISGQGDSRELRMLWDTFVWSIALKTG